MPGVISVVGGDLRQGLPLRLGVDSELCQAFAGIVRIRLRRRHGLDGDRRCLTWRAGSKNLRQIAMFDRQSIDGDGWTVSFHSPALGGLADWHSRSRALRAVPDESFSSMAMTNVTLPSRSHQREQSASLGDEECVVEGQGGGRRRLDAGHSTSLKLRWPMPTHWIGLMMAGLSCRHHTSYSSSHSCHLNYITI